MDKFKMLEKRFKGIPQQRSIRRSGAKRIRLNNGLFKGNMTARPGKEIKWFDTDATGQAVNTTGAVIQINNIAQGDDNVNREGKLVTLKSITLRCLNYSTDTTGYTQTHRIMLIYDKTGDMSNTATVIGDILESATTTSNLNKLNTSRYRVLMDEIINLGIGTHTGALDWVTWKKYKKLPNLECRFNSTGASIPIIGALMLVVVGSSAAGVTAGIMNYNARVRFQG